MILPHIFALVAVSVGIAFYKLSGASCELKVVNWKKNVNWKFQIVKVLSVIAKPFVHADSLDQTYHQYRDFLQI